MVLSVNFLVGVVISMHALSYSSLAPVCLSHASPNNALYGSGMGRTCKHTLLENDPIWI